jgi:non-ribosomal peptide synthetase component E (peptide arylation enzyme)
MAYDHMVSLTRIDGSRRIFHVHGRPTPKRDEVITLPVDGRPIKAQILWSVRDPETQADEAVAVETMET